MGYKIVSAPKQEETLDPMLKKMYICSCRGCGWIHEKNTMYCADHKTAADRRETEAEWNARMGRNEQHASQASGTASKGSVLSGLR